MYMSKIKDKVIEEQNNLKSRPATMDEINALHDEWWNSLTEEDKRKLFDEQEAMEKNRLDGKR